jgi:hypothetical protein
MEWSEVKTKQFKLLSAAVGASAVVAMGALSGAFPDEQPGGTAPVGKGPELTLGETVTTTTPPAAPLTSVASPTMTATTPAGFR